MAGILSGFVPAKRFDDRSGHCSLPPPFCSWNKFESGSAFGIGIVLLRYFSRCDGWHLWSGLGLDPCGLCDWVSTFLVRRGRASFFIAESWSVDAGFWRRLEAEVFGRRRRWLRLSRRSSFPFPAMVSSLYVLWLSALLYLHNGGCFLSLLFTLGSPLPFLERAGCAGSVGRHWVNHRSPGTILAEGQEQSGTQ